MTIMTNVLMLCWISKATLSWWSHFLRGEVSSILSLAILAPMPGKLQYTICNFPSTSISYYCLQSNPLATIYKPSIKDRRCDLNLSRRQGNKQALADGVQTMLRLLFPEKSLFSLEFQHGAIIGSRYCFKCFGAALGILNQALVPTIKK